MDNKTETKMEGKTKDSAKTKGTNPMREIKIDKIVLSVGGTGEYLDKGFELLKMLTDRTPTKAKSRKRIPALGVRPKLEVGTLVTIRKNPEKMLKNLLNAYDNVLKKSQIDDNNFSFGIKEYIEIPGVEYRRDIGILGFDVTVVFKRAGRRVKLKKVNKGKLPARQKVLKKEIIKFMEENFGTRFE
ncbi:MAG: 50S ribosomal protein L5 [Candidatus Pacearchaeota archaeon]